MSSSNPPGPTGVTTRAIAPAPPVKSRPARPEKRPEIKLSEREAERRFISPVSLAIGAIALAATVGLAHKIMSKTEDPHYLRATENLNQYEMGKPELERNYDSSIYTEALSDLAKVDPDSISAEKAALLVTDIKSRTDLFRRRLAAREEAHKAIQDARLHRDAEYLANREKTIMNPRKVFPECKEEKDGHAH